MYQYDSQMNFSSSSLDKPPSICPKSGAMLNISLTKPLCIHVKSNMDGDPCCIDVKSLSFLQIIYKSWPTAQCCCSRSSSQHAGNLSHQHPVLSRAAKEVRGWHRIFQPPCLRPSCTLPSRRRKWARRSGWQCARAVLLGQVCSKGTRLHRQKFPWEPWSCSVQSNLVHGL